MRTPEQQRQYRMTRPEKAAEYQRVYVQRHPDRIKESAKKRYQKVATIIREAKNKPCADCGKEYPSCVMDFDHRDPAIKEFEIATKSSSYKALRAEIEKCDVVCSNCHRLRTFKTHQESR